MHNVTKILREFDEQTILEAQKIVDEDKIFILNRDNRGIKVAVEYQGEEFICFILFGEDLSIINTICSCDHITKKCVHVAAVLLYIKKNYIRQINKIKRETNKNNLAEWDYFKCRDFLIRSISEQTFKRSQLKAIFIDNKKITKDQRSALFSLGFANYLHEGSNSNDFKSLMKPIDEIIYQFIQLNYFTEEEIVRFIYDSVTLFDKNDFKKFLYESITDPFVSPILQKVNCMLPDCDENCCKLIKDHEDKIIKGIVPLAYETLFHGLLHYSYLENISFDVYKVGLTNALHGNSIDEFTNLLLFGFMRYGDINKVMTDELVLHISTHHVEFYQIMTDLIDKLDIDQINAYLIYLLAKIATPYEFEKISNLIISKIKQTKSVNSALLLYVLRQESQYEITVTNSNYRQICQIIEYAKDSEKQYLTNLIVKRLENNFIECKHLLETNYEVELLLKSHQDYIQFFLENSLSKVVDRERRLFYLNLARKYKLLNKVGLHIFEE